MIFDWDERKNVANVEKHGVRFEDAVFVFEDPFHLTRPERVVDGELRWLAIGEVFGALLLVVAHTLDTEEDEEYVRIISARRAELHERRSYEEGE